MTDLEMSQTINISNGEVALNLLNKVKDYLLSQEEKSSQRAIDALCTTIQHINCRGDINRKGNLDYQLYCFSIDMEFEFEWMMRMRKTNNKEGLEIQLDFFAEYIGRQDHRCFTEYELSTINRNLDYAIMNSNL